jgi:predicted metalloprotease with PDZ domain
LSFCLGAAFGPIGIVMALLLPSDTTESKSRQVDDLNALTKNHGKIGLMLSPDDPQTICSVPINSPAFIAGVRSGDRLVMIDGTICNDDYKNTALKLVGPAGSIVKLTVRRRDEVFEALIKRV